MALRSDIPAWTTNLRVSIALGLCVGFMFSYAALRPVASSASEEVPITTTSGFQELSGMYVYLDPGHGGTENHAVGQTYGTLEKDAALQISLALGALLQSHGAQVYYSRTADETVSLFDRIYGSIQGARGGNNPRYDAAGGITVSHKWRLMSIHLNAPNDPQSEFNGIEIFRKRSGYRPEAVELAQNMVDQSSRFSNTWNATHYVGRWTQTPDGCTPNDPDPTCDLYTIAYSRPAGFNVYSEVGYLTNEDFEEDLVNGSLVSDLAYGYYRAFVDYWLTGYRGIHANKNQNIVDEYWSKINAGRDPGVPFDNGGGYYVHEYPGDGRAWTQEFNAPNGLLGSILECKTAPCPPANVSGAYYIRGPVWSTYIEKNGPNNNGPGLPWGGDTLGNEHSWFTPRGVRNNTFTYPQTQNFENGVIYWNAYEGSTSATTASHAVFLPNCRAGDINSNWAAGYLRNMIGRFALSNDRPGPTPLPTPLARYNDGNVHPDDPATRAQLAQSLMFAEGYSYYNGSGYEYSDIQGHWGRPWIRMVSSLFIANGYPDGTFRPDNYATRAQFSKMLALARGWTLINPTPPAGRVSNTCPASSGGYYSFTDVCYNLGDLYNGVETAWSQGIIGGYQCGGSGEPCDAQSRPYFRPGNNVTRAQISKMVDSALTNNGYLPGPCWGEPSP